MNTHILQGQCALFGRLHVSALLEEQPHGLRYVTLLQMFQHIIMVSVKDLRSIIRHTEFDQRWVC
jgi:hypothetical protein